MAARCMGLGCCPAGAGVQRSAASLLCYFELAQCVVDRWGLVCSFQQSSSAMFLHATAGLLLLASLQEQLLSQEQRGTHRGRAL